MSRESARRAVAAVLQQDLPAAGLDEVIAQHFPHVQTFRENDDLVILRGDTHRLLVRRTGPDRFRTSENAAASGSTNLLDQGGGHERDLDGLLEEIAGLADL
jgi:hypothetical protein